MYVWVLCFRHVKSLIDCLLARLVCLASGNVEVKLPHLAFQMSFLALVHEHLHTSTNQAAWTFTHLEVTGTKNSHGAPMKLEEVNATLRA